ncbi:MAG: cupin domain-containing protein [Chitinophagaceae bacterium]|nr:MAG: cupin domain-containing protein [Chitinophagaceae bacterium]
MAYKGKRIVNPVNKQTIEFVATAKESDGQQLEMIASWAPHSLKPAAHYHPYQDEVFNVLEGELTLELNGQLISLKRGEGIHIPANAVHAMWNNTNDKTVVSWKVFPALDTEYFLETGMGLATSGKTNQQGMPDLLQVALLAKKYRREFRLNKPAYLVQQILFSLLAPFAKLAGKKAVYPEYLN